MSAPIASRGQGSDTQPLRLVFFGSGSFGLPTLQRLVREHRVELIVTQPDRPARRHRQLTPTPIGEFALQQGIAKVKPENVNAAEVVASIHGLEADAYVVIAYGHKLGHALLRDTFAVNLHGSLLPKYRGAAPINWAMINGESQTGVSVITLAQTMDAGDILATAATPIDPRETAGELHDRLALLGPDVVAQTLEAYRAGTLQRQAQDQRFATRAPKLSKADGTVSFDQPARAVRQRVHGLTPWPGCVINVAGKPLRLHRVSDVDVRHDALPGSLLADRAIACAGGAIQLLEVQPPGGRIMSFEEYCNGHRVVAGAVCEAVS